MEPHEPHADQKNGHPLVPRWIGSILVHVLLFALSWLLAFCLAYNFRYFARWFSDFFLVLLPVVLVVKLTIFVAMGLHRGWWHYVGLRDVFNVARAAWVSFLIIWVIYYLLANLHRVADGMTPLWGHDFPDSVFLLDFAGTIALVSGTRIASRLYQEEIRPVQESALSRLLVLGAGDAGANVVREIERMPMLRYRVVGFLDDDPAKQGALIYGSEVLGPIARIKQVCEEYNVDEILIAMPSASRQQLRRVIEHCEGTNLRFKTVPALADLISGRAAVSQLRDVDINDLLGRAPVKLDEDQIGQFICDRVVAVTGAGGSIGSEMCRQIALFKPERLLLIEQAEQHLFEIDNELRREFPNVTCVPYIADIGDRGRIRHVFEHERPTAVFHAAAHKHVPMMEHNPGEALKNNILGTRVVADAAAESGAEKFVMISTDKAVNPTSIMGGSKRIAEQYIQGLNARVETQFVTVRFGNVLGSSGSVIPIFKEQIRRGGPVTVTHPDMVRYFMTIPEAAQLVLQAASMGDGGEIFVLDMGEPVKIVDLARQMITLSGFQPEKDIEIKFVGMRPGEKLYEELSIEGEDVSHTEHPKIGIWRNIPVEWESLVKVIDERVPCADKMSREEVRAFIKSQVPEFYLDDAPPARPPTSPATQPATRSA